MPFEEFARLVETHKLEIAKRAALALTTMGLPIYAEKSVSEIAQNFLPSLEVFADCTSVATIWTVIVSILNVSLLNSSSKAFRCRKYWRLAIL